MCVYLEMASEGLQAMTDRQYLQRYPTRDMKYIHSSFLLDKSSMLRDKSSMLKKSSNHDTHGSSVSPSTKPLFSESRNIHTLIEQCEQYSAEVESVVHSKLLELETRAIFLSKTPSLEEHEKKQWHELLDLLNNAFQPLPDCRFKSELTSLIQSIQSYEYEDVNADIENLEKDASTVGDF